MPRALPLLAALPLLVVVAPFCTVPEVDSTVEGGCGAGTLGIGETCEPRCQEGYAARGTGIGRCRASVSLFLSLSLSRRLCLPTGIFSDRDSGRQRQTAPRDRTIGDPAAPPPCCRRRHWRTA